MKLLLDTHILLWSALEPERLPGRVGNQLEDPANELWLSPISIWESIILAEKGRIRLSEPSAAWIRRIVREVGLIEAALNHEVALQSRGLRLDHQDPADRFLAATAIVYDLTLVTADKRLLGCSDYSVLSAH